MARFTNALAFFGWLVLSLTLGMVTTVGSGCDASCTIGRKINKEKLEGELVKRFTDSGGVVTKAECPSGIKTEKGSNFTCTVTAENGDKLTIKVEQTDAKGTVNFADDSDELVVMAKVERGIAGMLKKIDGIAKAGFDTATCPPDKKTKEGDTFECRSSAGNKTLIVTVEETDSHGSVTYGVNSVEMPASTLAEELVGMLAEKKIEASVDCGEAPIRIVDKNVVRCQATDKAGVKDTLEVLGTGNLGSYRWRTLD